MPARSPPSASTPLLFHAYAVLGLLSAYLLVPAFVALMAMIRSRSATWAYLAGGLAQIGLLVAVGDAATELVYSQMGAPSADPVQMTALAERYESVSSPIYGVGGLCLLVGTVLVAVALWRTRVCPRWAAGALPVSMVLNVAGFTAASKPVLVVSYLIMLGAMARIAAVVLELRSPREAVAERVPA